MKGSTMFHDDWDDAVFYLFFSMKLVNGRKKKK